MDEEWIEAEEKGEGEEERFRTWGGTAVGEEFSSNGRPPAPNNKPLARQNFCEWRDLNFFFPVGGSRATRAWCWLSLVGSPPLSPIQR